MTQRLFDINDLFENTGFDRTEDDREHHRKDHRLHKGRQVVGNSSGKIRFGFRIGRQNAITFHVGKHIEDIDGWRIVLIDRHLIQLIKVDVSQKASHLVGEAVDAGDDAAILIQNQDHAGFTDMAVVGNGSDALSDQFMILINGHADLQETVISADTGELTWCASLAIFS